MPVPRADDRPLLVLGIDAAVSARDVGVAVARWDGADCRLLTAFGLTGGARMGAALPPRLLPWLAAHPVGLLAIDAPLGWPTAMRSLVRGAAGRSLASAGPGRDRFVRHTDRAVRAATGKVPLAVGADRIARTAAESLTLLGALRRATGMPLPLAWSPDARDRWRVIEVYPAATAIAHADRPQRRDGDATAQAMALVARCLRGARQHRRLLAANRHVLDACLAVVAARDFLRGDAMAPTAAERHAARAEGWIWCRAPQAPGATAAAADGAAARQHRRSGPARRG